MHSLLLIAGLRKITRNDKIISRGQNGGIDKQVNVEEFTNCTMQPSVFPKKENPETKEKMHSHHMDN